MDGLTATKRMFDLDRKIEAFDEVIQEIRRLGDTNTLEKLLDLREELENAYDKLSIEMKGVALFE